MGKITQEDISVFLEEFENLDADQSGTLSTYDLMVAQPIQK
jgi:potassium channel subfamily K, other eukaryote